MSHHETGNGEQGHAAGRPAAPGPHTADMQQGGASQAPVQGPHNFTQMPGAQIPGQGWTGAAAGASHVGMFGAGMPGPQSMHPGHGTYPGQPVFGFPGMHPGMHPGITPHPAAYGPPPGVDPYWAYHAQAQAAQTAQTAHAPPPFHHAGMTPPNTPWSGAGPNPAQTGGMGRMSGGYGAGGAGMAQLVDEIANGGNGLSSLTKMLDFDDSEFWKGALLGAAAVLLLTNESVQSALFKTGAKTKAAVKTGVDRVKESIQQPKHEGKGEVADV
jgi:hypothetical protein